MDYIKVNGFKSIDELYFDVRPINILIGGNGAGKSNFISLFRFLHEAYRQNMAGYVSINGDAEKFVHNGPKVTQKIEIELSFENRTSVYGFGLVCSDANFRTLYEEYRLDDNIWNEKHSDTELRIKYNSAYSAKHIRSYLDGLRVFHFHDVGKLSPFNATTKVFDNTMLHSDGRNLAAYLLRLRSDEPKTYRRIVTTIRHIAPYFDDFILEPHGDENIRLRWSEAGSELVYGAADFSDGTMRFVALTALFLQPTLPATLIIDEPELGLHPMAIEILASLIRGASKQGCQVIVATQSVELVSFFEPEEVVVVDRHKGSSVFSRLKTDSLNQWLESYSLGELWKQNIINSGQPSK